MSEHIQPALGPQTSHGTVAPAQAHEQTPGVWHEREKFSLRLILWCGAGLVGIGILIHVGVAWLLGGLEKHHAVPPGSISELAMEDASRPLGRRVGNVPPPHLEGIDPLSTLLIFRTEAGENERFYVARSARVQIGDKKDVSLYQLRLGQRATITYHMPGGVPDAMGIVNTVITPPIKAEKEARSEQPEVSRTLNGEIVKLMPQDIAAGREWAEVQSKRSGWIDREKGIVHIPIERAMQEVLDSKEFAKGERKKSAGHRLLPTRSNSGRGARGDQR